MAKELPYFKFEPNAWENGNIQILSREDKGLFVDICSMFWSRLGDLPEKLVIQKLCNGNKDALKSLYEENIIENIEGSIYIKFLSIQLQEFENISNKNSENAKERWRKYHEQKDSSDGNATAVPNVSEVDAIRGEKIIEEERIEKDIYPFDDFWNLYDKKRDKEKCKDKWKKISAKDKQEIMEFIPKYQIAQPEKKYRKDPIRFLNNKTWQDELEVAEESKSPQDQKTFYQYKTTDDLLKDYPSQYTIIAYMFWRLWISEQETKTLIDATVEEWTNQVKNIIEVDKQRIERLIAVYQFFKQCKSQQAGYDTFWYSKTKTIASFRNTNQNGEYKLDLIANEVNDKIARDSDFGRLVQNKIKQFKEHESIKLS